MNPIRRHLQVAAIVAALAVPVVTTSGCGLTFSQDIALANGAVSVVQMLVTAIQGWERNYYTGNPNPDQQSKIEKLIASTLAADALVAEAIQTTKDAKSEQVSAAFADLMVDYQDLLTLLRDAGVVSAPSGSNLTAEPLAARLYVLAPEDILPKSVDVEKVKAKVSAKRAARARANDLAMKIPVADPGEDVSGVGRSPSTGVRGYSADGYRGAAPGDSASPADAALMFTTEVETVPAIACMNGTTLQKRDGEWDCYPPYAVMGDSGGVAMVDRSGILFAGSWAPLERPVIELYASRIDGGPIVESSLLPQWLAVPIAMGLAAR